MASLEPETGLGKDRDVGNLASRVCYRKSFADQRVFFQIHLLCNLLEPEMDKDWPEESK